ncbi:MAG: ATP-binding protein [Bacteroidales bacterium]|nr:ATP-binding protein [Bacteroidales bacterium]
MMLESQIEEVLEYQTKSIIEIQEGTPRDITDKVDLTDNHVKILTGIRRCGKSTVLLQIARKHPHFNYLSFEDPRLSAFGVNDFFKLEKIFGRIGNSELFFFDEIQNVDGWERYVRVLHDKKQKVIVTGSNAKILSKELGTSLTGRQISLEVFPFSYVEYLAHFNLNAGVESFSGYFQLGGMPEFLNTKNRDVLLNLYNDLIYRDIVVRHGLRNPKIVKELGVFLATNIGKEFSFNNLAKTFELGSSNTVASYISYFEDAYLFLTVPRFSFSLKQQAKNPKKIYGIDTGLITNLSMSFSKDQGRLLENLVFIHLLRLGKDVYYYRQKGECNFIVSKNNKVEMAVQVCYDLNVDNLRREVNGLAEALNELGLTEGFIFTFNQKDELEKDGKIINVIPVWEWMK